MQRASLPTSEYIGSVVKSRKVGELEQAIADVFAQMVDDYSLNALNGIFNHI